MDYFVTRNKRSASSGTQPPASRPRIIEETESERNITAIPIEVNIQQSDEDRDHLRMVITAERICLMMFHKM